MTNHDDILKNLYDSKSTHQKGQSLVNLIYKHLSSTHSGQSKTIPFKEPAEMLKYWESYNISDPIQIISDFVEQSIHLHNPRYMGHQVVPPVPDTILVSLITSLLNNGGAVYEMGMASNALEKIVLDRLIPYFGFDSNAGGIFTSGGTLANLTALLTARAVKIPKLWQEGSHKKYAFMVSEEAHYCIERAVKIMGWGEDGIIKVPVNNKFKLDASLLEQYYHDATIDGIEIIGIVGSAPTTSTGIYDDLETIGQFSQKHDLWYHIDAAHGGAAVFSQKYGDLMKGSQLADSIVVDGHKMMMMPALSTKLIFKNKKHCNSTFQQEAKYLWEDQDYDWSNPGKATFECTKYIMSLQYFVIMQQYGIEAFQAFVDQCYDNGSRFAHLIKEDSFYDLAFLPESNIVCFKPKHLVSTQHISFIRKTLIQQGHFYIVQTSIKNQAFLRVSLMNPFTTLKDMKDLLQTIKHISIQEK